MGDPDQTLPASAAAGTGAGTLASGALLGGRYRIARFLGAGGMGEVYAAADVVLGTTIALKILRAELAGSTVARARFRREMALARKVTSAHVCRLHDVGEHDGGVFLTMELLEGRTLAEHLRGADPLTVAEVERIAAQLVAGLAALHAAGVVHRDFKPGNVMVTDGGRRAVITDFGLARAAADGDVAVTAELGLLGTPAYMAPEQVEGRPATPASDVYALGVTLFELLTGTVPFRAETALATATARLHRAPPRPSSVRADVPARWDAIVARCLARDPSRRPHHEEVLAPPARASRRWFVAAGAAAMAGAGVGAWRWITAGTDAIIAAGTMAEGARVALLIVDGPGELLADPWRLALTVDLHDALATSGMPLLALDGGGNFENLGGTITRLAAAPMPAVAAWRLDGVVAVIEPVLASRPDEAGAPLVVDVTVGRRGAAPWSQRFVRPGREGTLLVDDLAGAIAAHLGARRPARPADAGVHEPATYVGYGAALADLFRARGRDRAAALDALVASRPELHRASARLALHLAERSQRREDDRILPDTQQAVTLADRVLAADPDHVVALTARGVAALTLYDWPTADRALARAVELAPAQYRAGQERAAQLMYQGRFDEHHRVADGQRALNPLAYQAPSLAWSHYYSRRYADVARYVPTVLAAAEPHDRTFLLLLLASSYAELARYDDALEIADQFLDTDDPYLRAALVSIYVLAGDLAQARAMRAQIGARAGAEAGALMDDALGDVDAALDGLERCVAGHFVEALYLKIERFTPALRSHPRFQALMAKVGLPP